MSAVGSVAYGQGTDYYTSGAGVGAAQRSAQGGTSYYTGASSSGEPPGRWLGAGAASLGLTGTVDAEAMKRLYERGLDPRDETGGTRFGTMPAKYAVRHEMVKARLIEAGQVSPERAAELWSVARDACATPRQAEERLETLLGTEAGMLAEDVRAVQLEVSRSVRQDNRFADFTFSPSKDITVQHTAAEWAERQAVLTGRTDDAELYRYVRETIEAAIVRGNDAALAYLTEHAGYARTGRHGKGAAGTWTEARDWTVASFFQHTSRAQDPQLHVHNPILLDTVCPSDGKVRKIHTTLIQGHRTAAAAVGSRVMQEAITSQLGWIFAMRTDGVGYELTNVDQRVKALFSERSTVISRQAQEYIRSFAEKFGYEPNAIQVARIKYRATRETRQAKPKGDEAETREQLTARWDAELRAEVGAGMARQAALAGRSVPPLPATFSPVAVIEEAIARLQEAGSTFTAPELTAMIDKCLPAYVGLTEPADVIALLDGLTAAATRSEYLTRITNQPVTAKLPAALTLANGESAYVQPGSTRWASTDHIAAEHAFQRAAIVRGRAAASADAVDRWIADHGGMGLGKDQAAALRGIATSGAATSVLIGPAGAGKTYVLGALSQAWDDLTGGRVIGLATSEAATDVLRGEGVAARNIAQWLGVQGRLAQGRATSDDAAWAVRPGDIIVPDEASMADTDKLAQVREYVERAGARILLTGDHRQLSAVGAGGVMELIVSTGEADTYELCEVRRFTSAWEGPASLDLRAGKVEVLDTYDAHGRIIDGGTAETAAIKAARMYLGDRLSGRSSLVVVPTNALAAQVNSLVRDHLIEIGKVERAGVLLPRDGGTASVGDLIKCRQNAWDLGVKNQGRYEVMGIGDDGTLRVRDEATEREITLPASYVGEWVELGYASTVHGAQGATVDTGISIVQPGMSGEQLYPAMTRGRERNTALVVTRTEVEGQTTGQTHERQPRDAVAVVADIIETDNEAGRAALTLQREAIAQARSLRTISDMRENAVRLVVRERTGEWLDRLVAEGALSADERQTLAADRATEQLGRLLRSVEQAGHDPQEALRRAVTSRSLDDAKSPAQVVYARVSRAHRGQLSPDLDLADVAPAGAPDDFREHLDELADLARERRGELGEQVAQEPPAWARETLGPVPDDVIDRAEWVHRAGIIAGYREAASWNDEVEALNPAPGLAKTEARIGWHQAWQAAGRPDATAEETTMSVGALRVRVKAVEQVQAWMPPAVHDEMRATELELAAHQQEQAILAAQATAAADEIERARLAEQAADKAAMADRLEAKRAELQAITDARLAAIAEQEMTRDLGQRALAELAARGVDLDAEETRTTAAEWLAAERQARAEDDPHRVVTEADVVDQKLENFDHGTERADDDQAHSEPVVEHQDDEHQDDAEPANLPQGVPTDEQIRAAAVVARVAEHEIADRESLERARAASEAEASRQAYDEARHQREASERAAEQADSFEVSY